jgi:uncharacterized membrane protein YeaQ/YmgE (transglycosylase-associated protein family)
MRNQLVTAAAAIVLMMLSLPEISIAADAEYHSSHPVFVPQLHLWFTIGAIAGSLLSKIIPRSGFGLRANMGIGILGAVIGGYVLLPQLDFVADQTGANFIAATVGTTIILLTISLIHSAVVMRQRPRKLEEMP